MVSRLTRPQILRGSAAVLAMVPVALELAKRTGVALTVDDFHGTLLTASAIHREPYLLVFQEGGLDSPIWGAVLLWETLLGPLKSGIFTTPDLWGRRCVIAPTHLRAQTAALAAAALISNAGGFFVSATYSREGVAGPSDEVVRSVLETREGGKALGLRRWSLKEHSLPAYLELRESMDATLARINKHTRFNFRYYRRRLVREVGCEFVAEASISSAELRAFNDSCMYPVSPLVVRVRHQALTEMERPLFAGIRDRQGRWLSLVGGHWRDQEIVIDWQMNRADLPKYSLGTVVRSYLIEHAIEKGARRLYVEGGTEHPMRHSFIKEGVGEVTLVHNTLRLWLLRTYLKWGAGRRHRQGEILLDSQVDWKQ